MRSALGFQGSGLACFLVLALDSRKAQGGEHPGVSEEFISSRVYFGNRHYRVPSFSQPRREERFR